MDNKTFKNKMPQFKQEKAEAMAKAFKKVLDSKLRIRNMGTVEDMRNIYVIEQYEIPTIIKLLIREVSIRVYIGGK